MTTIRRNWTKRVAEIRTAARTCHAYDSDSGNMLPIDPARAFEAWESTQRARLTEDTAGQKWTVHVHSNRFYVLTAEEPATTAEDEPAAEVPGAPTAVPGTRRAHQAAGPASAQDRSAARTLARHARASGVPDGDRLPGHLSALAVELVGKTVRVKLAQGYSHAQIRDQFEQERAEAQAAGDARRVTALGTVLAVHAAMAAAEDTAPSPTGPAPAAHGPSSPEEQQPARHRPGSPRERRVSHDSVLSRIDSVLHDAAVTHDDTVSSDAMRSVPLTDPGDIIHAYTRAQALADGVLVAADAELAREAGFRVPVALTSAAWEGCVAWNEGDSERQTPQDERGRLWDVLTMCRAAIRRSGGGDGQVTVDLRRVPRDGRARQAQPVQLVCAIGPGDHGEPVITVMEPDEG
ncbi:DUF6573 family protein [Streptomyces sp. TLI_185]|uniref:DUF6573 family protein n=1 Tax=Streptomyces sp. TLI_185 TaxID=2485151 RepID=UPI000FA3584A|nr:DUF6573 family protein [Streptomyces sp. TLI_185]RPF30261.1 hypothetical protein EDD92_0009 [Streptomyces sp. TLI_185]